MRLAFWSGKRQRTAAVEGAGAMPRAAEFPPGFGLSILRSSTATEDGRQSPGAFGRKMEREQIALNGAASEAVAYAFCIPLWRACYNNRANVTLGFYRSPSRQGTYRIQNDLGGGSGGSLRSHFCFFWRSGVKSGRGGCSTPKRLRKVP